MIAPRLALVSILAFLTLGISPAGADEPEGGKTDISSFMRVKLVHSQQILEGLTTEDFDTVAKNSQALALLSLSSNWRVMQTEEYVQLSKEFRRLADNLTETAKAKNLEGATLAYVILTTNCIRCHQHIRQARLESRRRSTDRPVAPERKLKGGVEP